MSRPPRTVITGAAGQLGSALLRAAQVRGTDVLALARAQCDVTARGDVDQLPLTPHDVVINCAAYTAVDAAETDQDAATALNATAPGLLAARCAATGARLVHLSTDYVFGQPALPHHPQPWEPTDAAAPASVYGRSKRAGERAATRADPRTVIVRTAWVYTGRDQAGRWARDFVGTMGSLAERGTDPRVVDDQVGSPTYAPDLAAGLIDLVEHLTAEPDRPGAVLHAAGGGSATWFELARAVFDRVGADPDRVTPCPTTEFPRPAQRPTYSVLSSASWTDLGLAALPDWPDALTRALASPAPRAR